MALAKAVVTGTVYRAPEVRFTQNDVSVASFVLDIGEKDQTLIRVISLRKNLEDVINAMEVSSKVLVEGRLQITTVKNDVGTERKVYEINANTIEIISETGTTGSLSANSNADIVKFEQEEFAEDLIGEEEIPF